MCVCSRLSKVGKKAKLKWPGKHFILETGNKRRNIIPVIFLDLRLETKFVY